MKLNRYMNVCMLVLCAEACFVYYVCMHYLPHSDDCVSFSNRPALQGLYHPITASLLKVSFPRVLQLPAEEMTVLSVELI